MQEMKISFRNNIFFLVILSWLVPGSGHYLLSKKNKALFFFTVLTGTFITGLFLGGRSFFLDTASYFTFLAFIAESLNGGIYIISASFDLFKDNLTGFYYDSGVIYNIVPGLLNFLVVLDVIDTYRKGKSTEK